MVRAALKSRRKIGQGPRLAAGYIPAISVLLASYLAALPIVSQTGWWPEFGFMMLVAWRLLRADVWPAWWAAPLGLANDLFTGAPIGLSVVVWTTAMLALDIIDRRTMWRDYWIEWALAALLILALEVAEWRVAAMMGAPMPLMTVVPPLLISIFTFPLAAWLVGRIDAWRLGR